MTVSPRHLASVFKRPRPDNRGLVAWWTFDNGGNVQADYSGLGNRVVLSGTVPPVRVRGIVPSPGQPGGALKFDGSTSKADVTTTKGLGITTKSIFCWAYIPGSLTGGWQTIIQYNRGGAETYGLWRSGNTGVNWSWRVNGNFAGDFTNTMVANRWYHIGFTFVGGTSGAVRVYQNGALDSSTTATSQTPLVGAACTIGYDSNGEFYPGLIDDLRIYNRVLSDEEVKALYLSAFQPVEEVEMDVFALSGLTLNMQQMVMM